MNETTLAKLEFDAVRQALAARCATSLGKRLAAGLRPVGDTRRVRQWLDQVRELQKVAADHGLPPLLGAADVGEQVRASTGAIPLEPDALARIADTLDAAANVRAWLAQVGDGGLPALEHVTCRIGEFHAIAAAIKDAIDSRGEVRDLASTRLVHIRDAIAKSRDQARQVFDRLLRQPSTTRMLQYASATFHDDRAVLPLKAEYRGRIPGIIHRVSDSGATLFVEPAEVVAINNSIVQLRDEERTEITRILRRLTQLVGHEAEGILATVRALGALDVIAAKCRYAKDRACICPDIRDDGVLYLHDARHPVLIELFAQPTEDGPPREVVPIDVRLGDDFDVLVVTGPNTGGKTVMLKTVGLLALMTQAGIPLPVGPGSAMSVFRQIFVDIGDEQSIQQSLSTFSSHLSNQLAILGHSGPRSLILIDELGAGTDPDEGAAIGAAVIAEIQRLRARAVVTTHLSALKALAFTRSRVDNASVEFDPETLRPTYHVRLGEPGNSNALIIAERLGMSRAMVQHARKQLEDRERLLQKAIAGTLHTRRQAEDARRAAREAELRAEEARAAFEQQSTELETARTRFDSWRRWVAELRPGDPVFVPSIRTDGRVVRVHLHKQRVAVSAGALEFEVDLADVQPPEQA